MENCLFLQQINIYKTLTSVPSRWWERWREGGVVKKLQLKMAKYDKKGGGGLSRSW